MSADTIVAEQPTGQTRAPDEVVNEEVSLFTRLKFMAVRGFLYGWARCFSLKGLHLFGQVFGTLEWMINYKRRRRFWERLHQAFGELERRYEILRQAASIKDIRAAVKVRFSAGCRRRLM